MAKGRMEWLGALTGSQAETEIPYDPLLRQSLIG